MTVVVATFGEQSWIDLAHSRAIPSAESQAPVIHSHQDSLAASRNAGLTQVKTEWVIHLDADDELLPGYVEAMSKGTADLRTPSVSYVRKHRAPREPGMVRVAGHLHECTAECLPRGNWLVVGTSAKTQMLKDVGGWEEWPVYEDWALWLRCWKAGATVEYLPDAVYRAHVNVESRNRAPQMQYRNQIHNEIVKAVL